MWKSHGNKCIHNWCSVPRKPMYPYQVRWHLSPIAFPSILQKLSFFSSHIGKKLGCKQAAYGLEESTLNCSFVVFQTVWMAGCSTSNQPQFANMHTCKWRAWSPFKNQGIWGPGWPMSALGFSFDNGRAIAPNRWCLCFLGGRDFGFLRRCFLPFLAQDAI